MTKIKKIKLYIIASRKMKLLTVILIWESLSVLRQNCLNRLIDLICTGNDSSKFNLFTLLLNSLQISCLNFNKNNISNLIDNTRQSNL